MGTEIKEKQTTVSGLFLCELVVLLEIIELEHLCNTLGNVLRDIDKLVFGAFCFCDGKRTGINALSDVVVCIIGVLIGVEGLAAKNGNHFNQISVCIIGVVDGKQLHTVGAFVFFDKSSVFIVNNCVFIKNQLLDRLKVFFDRFFGVS